MRASNSSRRRISACRSASVSPSSRGASTATPNRPRCPTLRSLTSLAVAADGALQADIADVKPRAHSALLVSRHTPDDIANIVRHQKRAIRTERDTDWSAIRDFLIRREKARQNIPRRTGWAPVLEGHEDDGVTAQRAAIPGAVLADHHAVRKARKRVGRQPAQAERRGVPAERVVRRNGLG